jgi:hypothetical protein
MASVFHFTDDRGWKGIRASTAWTFRQHDPPPEDHPPGAYFTRCDPGTPALSKKLRIPRAKLAYAFELVDVGDLTPIRGDRGERGISLYFPGDYRVERSRQRYEGPSTRWRSTEEAS